MNMYLKHFTLLYFTYVTLHTFLRDSILLRDTVGKNSGCYTFTRNEVSCIVNYLAAV